MEPFFMVIGATIAAVSFFAGRRTARRETRRELQQHQIAPPAPAQGQRTPQPLCGCGHHLVFHDQETKRCQTQVVIPGRWTGQANSTYRQCMCQGYRGPVPVDEYYAPDYLDGTNP